MKAVQWGIYYEWSGRDVVAVRAYIYTVGRSEAVPTGGESEQSGWSNFLSLLGKFSGNYGWTTDVQSFLAHATGVPDAQEPTRRCRPEPAGEPRPGPPDLPDGAVLVPIMGLDTHGGLCYNHEPTTPPIRSISPCLACRHYHLCLTNG